MGSNRSYTYKVTIDDAGDPDVIQVPDNAPQGIRKIELIETTGNESWLFSSDPDTEQVAQSPGKVKVFDQGPYYPGDILGYGEAVTASSIDLQLECHL